MKQVVFAELELIRYHMSRLEQLLQDPGPEDPLYFYTAAIHMTAINQFSIEMLQKGLAYTKYKYNLGKSIEEKNNEALQALDAVKRAAEKYFNPKK